MMRKTIAGLIGLTVLSAAATGWSQDVVLQWNQTLHDILQSDGTINSPDANPGWSTRSIAMMNTAIYDTFQTLHRTHAPFLYQPVTPNPGNYDVHAAANTAAFEVLKHCYGLTAPTAATLQALQTAYGASMAAIPNSPQKTAGISLGQTIAAGCFDNRTNPYDGSDRTQWAPYQVLDGAGKWRPQPGQNAWGPEWGSVRPFALADAAMVHAFGDALPALPALTSQQYTDAFNQVKAFGAVNSAVRTPYETETGLFWAYDRPGMGPPPALFIKNIGEIAAQVGTSEADNARLFAAASIAQADASIAAWDVKFKDNFWRPIGAIRGDRLDGMGGLSLNHDDGNPNTAEDPTWTPLGAPGANPLSTSDDFTPPFPAWTSGHATMGAAIFKSLELFFGNNFAAADAQYGNDPVPADGKFVLHSAEFNAAGIAGMTRSYSAFTEDASHWGIGKEGLETTPEGENAMSRIYLGVHWIMDQQDGNLLGENIAKYVAQHYFLPVPEPGAGVLALFAAAAIWRRRSAAGPR